MGLSKNCVPPKLPLSFNTDYINDIHCQSYSSATGSRHGTCATARSPGVKPASPDESLQEHQAEDPEGSSDLWLTIYDG